MTKPKYITEIENRFEGLEIRQRELRDTWDKFLEREAEDKSKLNDIYTLLCGSKLNKDNGGMIGNMGKLKKEVRKNTTWRLKITAAVSAVAAVLGFLVIKFSAIISNLKEFLNLK